jgi:hypothetical protein
MELRENGRFKYKNLPDDAVRFIDIIKSELSQDK